MSEITPPATQSSKKEVSLLTLAATNEGVRKIPAPTTMPTIIPTASFEARVGTGSANLRDLTARLFTAIRISSVWSGTSVVSLCRGVLRDNPVVDFISLYFSTLLRCPVSHIKCVRDDTGSWFQFLPKLW